MFSPVRLRVKVWFFHFLSFSLLFPEREETERKRNIFSWLVNICGMSEVNNQVSDFSILCMSLNGALTFVHQASVLFGSLLSLWSYYCLFSFVTTFLLMFFSVLSNPVVFINWINRPFSSPHVEPVAGVVEGRSGANIGVSPLHSASGQVCDGTIQRWPTRGSAGGRKRLQTRRQSTRTVSLQGTGTGRQHNTVSTLCLIH